MKSVFHAHFTVADIGDVSLGVMATHYSRVTNAASAISGKQTAIRLETDTRQAFDQMITKYYWYKDGDVNKIVLEMMNDIEKLISMGIEITRWKLEKDIKTIEEIEECKYIEVHQELLVKQEKLSTVKTIGARLGWHPSNNPREMMTDNNVRQFVNRRFSNAEQGIINSEIESLHWGIMSNAQISAPRLELVMVDSNLEHDSWWSSVNG